MCLVGVALLVLLGCCLVRFLLLFDSAWWNRGIAEEVTMASYGKAVTGTAVMARSANEEKKKKVFLSVVFWLEISGLGSRRCLRKYVPLAVVRLAP